MAPDAAEAKIKAAFICKFVNYVDWPGQQGMKADGAFVIGVLAGSVFAQELARAAEGLAVNGRPITIRRLGRGDPVEGLAVLFVGRSYEPLAEALAPARGKPILTVTESETARAPGSIVNFVLVDDKVRFDIALNLAEQSSLKISGRLLAVARTVIGKPS